MKMAPMETPQVQSCDVTDCDYNRRQQCHAIAVTIGDGDNPKCDTFWMATDAKQKAGDPAQIGRVGACRVSRCSYNHRLQCGAEGVMVGNQGRNAMCLTFNPGH
jgi:hypothetical protein